MNERAHISDWNWNQTNHAHEIANVTERPRIASKEIIKGMKGLDSIAKIGESYVPAYVEASCKNEMKKVLKIPASTKIREVAAIYKTYKETVIVIPAKTRIVKSHPAVYSTIQECVEKTAGHYQWRSILCEQNATTLVLKSFEKALSKSGYLVSNQVDGIINNKTTFAIKSYQKSKGLDIDGLVNMDTVKSLGIKY
ncbi:peptidoglycan-binding protein [Candidatus Ruthia endofausta]|uniref:Peptidoglycan-binding protein n=1 Tax=Candidatus Ruthia endofausta TaxID=2738852 RepID=A0A6N0HPW1_9GAMM|nr:peptidoglycan-binding domain-containing protein [Candidatus Ruthia endofausta]QKQ24356.1 peptidoglycan-binding protein [Candidatus Ruthia endofausta]